MSRTPFRITGVDLAVLPAPDLDASLRFYDEVLGLTFRTRWGSMPAAEFQAGDLTIAIMEPTAFGQEFRPHGVPLTLHVDDVAGARAHLEELGVTFVLDLIDSGVYHQATTRRSSSTRPATPWTSTTGTRRRRREPRARRAGRRRRPRAERGPGRGPVSRRPGGRAG